MSLTNKLVQRSADSLDRQLVCLQIFSAYQITRIFIIVCTTAT